MPGREALHLMGAGYYLAWVVDISRRSRFMQPVQLDALLAAANFKGAKIQSLMSHIFNING